MFNINFCVPITAIQVKNRETVASIWCFNYDKYFMFANKINNCTNTDSGVEGEIKKYLDNSIFQINTFFNNLKG